MVDNVTHLVDWRVRREAEDRRREVVVAKVTSVSATPPAARHDPGRSLPSAPSALVFDLMAYAASRRVRRP